MITEAMQKKYLSKILSSREFSASRTNHTYLTYLVKSKIEGKELKETTIAIEVFGKDASFNPAEDTIVRSHTYNLRKKLDQYYAHEGKGDKHRLEIPKGHYDIKFVEAEGNSVLGKAGLRTFLRQRYYVVIILILLLLLLLQWQENGVIEQKLKQYHKIDNDDPIWSDYLQSELPVLIAVGDHFFFSDYSEKYEDILGIRLGDINSMSDLEKLNNRFPGSKLVRADEPYFPYHSIWSIPPVLSLFFSVNKEPILRKSSSLSPQMLDEYNMIFLGSIKTLYILKHALRRSNLDFKISPHIVTYTPPDSGEQQQFQTSLHSSGPNDDLVLAVKLPGPVHNSIFIIASYHSLGAPAIAEYLADAETRTYIEKAFVKKLGEMPQYFELLFRVTGIDKTAYNTEILVLNKISKD